MPFWMVLSIWWEKTAKPWLKKNWVYIVFFPIGLLLLVAALSKKATEVKVVSPELSEADKVKRDAQAEKDEGLVKAALERDEELKKAEEEHDAAVSDRVTEQEQRAQNPPQDDNLTDFLKQVGKDVRK